MIQVTIGNNVMRRTVTVESSTTPHAVLNDNDIDYTRGKMYFNGLSISPDDLGKTFEQIGIINGRCFLINVVNEDVRQHVSDSSPLWWFPR